MTLRFPLVHWPVFLRRTVSALLLMALALLGGCARTGDVPSPPQSAGSASLPLPPDGSSASASSVETNGEQSGPAPWTCGQTAVSLEDLPWNLKLVNGDHPLPDDFEVPETTELENGHAVDSRAFESLEAMLNAARAEGLHPVVCSSLRSWDYQERLYRREVDNWLERGYSQAEAEREAAVWVARPGTSEHQLGLAMDIVDLEYQILDQG